MAANKTFVYRFSYRTRIWIAFVSVLTLAIAAMGVLFYNMAAGAAQKNASQLNREALNKTAQTLESKLNHVRMSVLSMMLNPNYRKTVGLEFVTGPHNYYTYLSIMQDTFIQLQLIEPLIDSILVVTPDGDYYLMTQKRQEGVSFYNSAMYERIMSQPGFHREIWVEDHEDPFFAGNQRVVSFVTEGTMSDVSKNVFVVASIKVSKLREFVTSDLGPGKGQYLLLSDAGTAFIRTEQGDSLDSPEYAAFKKELGQDGGNFEYGAGSKRYIVNFTKLSPKYGVTLFSVLSKSDLLNQLNGIKWVMSAIILGCLLGSFLFADLFTRWLLKPLNYFRKLMRHVEGNDLSVRFENRYQDEFSHLGSQFNRMLDEINRLFLEVTVAEKEKRRAEMNALQAQINPHFLYNTLNAVYWKSQMNQLKDVQHMVLALSRLYQLGLNKGRDMTTLGSELLHVEHYLSLQQLCYQRLFVYSIDTGDGVDLEQPILKVLLQPLAENCIVHGFKDMSSGGIIRIEVAQEDGCLLLTVEDNGKGFVPAEPEEATDVPDRPSPDAGDGRPHAGYALFNVRQRLRLQYGDAAGLAIESVKDRFTRITLTIPASGNE